MAALRETLLSILAGTHAQAWMTRADLFSKSGAAEAEFSAAFDQMKAARLINTCAIIRPGVSIEAVWLTGMEAAKTSWKDFAVNPNKIPPSGSLRRDKPPLPPKPDKGQVTMQENSEKPISQQVLDIIILRPGITPSALRERFPDDKKTKKAISNALNNLRLAKKIERRDDAGVERLHPTSAAASTDKAKPPRSAKAPAAKLLTGDSAAAFQGRTNSLPETPAALPHPKENNVHDQKRGIAKFGFFDDERLIISDDETTVDLSPQDIVRLRDFLNKIFLRTPTCA